MLADLELTLRLGEGGYGVVHLARHRVSGELFAVKSFLKSKIRRQVKREMRMKEVACVFASADPKSRSEFVALLRKVQGGGLWQEEEMATEPATVGQRVTRDCTRPCYR